MTASGSPVPLPPPASIGLRRAVREIERHAAGAGWDRAPRLFALVPSAALVAAEPALAAQLGLDPEPAPDALTPVEQDDLAFDQPLEDLLATIEWPAEVLGVALVLETVVLPPAAEEALPEDRPDVAAAAHPEREEARIAVAVLRDGSRACALRWRRHDDDTDVLTAPDLAPGLAEALAATLLPWNGR